MKDILKKLGFKYIGGVGMYQHKKTLDIISFYGVQTESDITIKILEHGKNKKAKEIRIALNMD